MKFHKYLLLFLINLSCKDLGTKLRTDKSDNIIPVSVSDTQPTLITQSKEITTNTANKVENEQLSTSPVSRHELVLYAKSLIGIPYKYASTDPAEGFDCSGFITFVFNHFNWEVPRSSVDFTNYGQQINPLIAKEGDLILFTGTNDSIRIVGHMGIITQNTDTLKFIHSTSGRAYGVTISNLTEHYQKRFVKVIRIFPD